MSKEGRDGRKGAEGKSSGRRTKIVELVSVFKILMEQFKILY